VRELSDKMRLTCHANVRIGDTLVQAGNNETRSRPGLLPARTERDGFRTSGRLSLRIEAGKTELKAISDLLKAARSA